MTPAALDVPTIDLGATEMEHRGAHFRDLALGWSGDSAAVCGWLAKDLHLIGGIGDRLRYIYDFGDDWQHEIVVEDLLDPDPETHYPALVAAKGACPPEDFGGPWGYADLKAILADPSHEQRQEMLDWLGLDNSSEFDPDAITTEQIEYELALNGASR